MRGNNIFDIILTTDPMCMDKIDLLPPMGHSDHGSISFTITLSFIATQKTPLIQKPNFNRANWENVASWLATIRWPLLLQNCLDIESCWAVFKINIDHGIAFFIPLSKPLTHNHSKITYPVHVRKLANKKLH